MSSLPCMIARCHECTFACIALQPVSSQRHRRCYYCHCCHSCRYYLLTAAAIATATSDSCAKGCRPDPSQRAALILKMPSCGDPARALRHARRKCDYCLLPSMSRRLCPCREARYCDTVCQGKAWKEHKPACRFHAAKTALQDRVPKPVAKHIMLFTEFCPHTSSRGHAPTDMSHSSSRGNMQTHLH